MDGTDLYRFVDEHLTASALMVELAPPLPAATRAYEARRFLKKREFDLALIAEDRLRVVTLERLFSLKTKADDAKPVGSFGETPRRDRLIERTLPIRQVVERLRASRDPLLVVGEAGVSHIITVADFAGVAGTAVVLAFMLAVDRGLNELLLRRRDDAIGAVTETQRQAAQEHLDRAVEAGAELDLVDYLSMGARFTALRRLRLHETLDLGTREQHKLMLDARNAAAHRELADPEAGLEAIKTAEWMLERLAAVLAEPREIDVGLIGAES